MVPNNIILVRSQYLKRGLGIEIRRYLQPQIFVCPSICVYYFIIFLRPDLYLHNNYRDTFLIQRIFLYYTFRTDQTFGDEYKTRDELMLLSSSSSLKPQDKLKNCSNPQLPVHTYVTLKQLLQYYIMRQRPSVHDALFIYLCLYVPSMQHVRAEPERFAKEHQKCTVGSVVERSYPGPVLEQLAEECPIRSASDHAPRPQVVQRGQPELQRLEIVSQVRVVYHTIKCIL